MAGAKSILVSFDHFRVGGRETYIESYGRLLREQGYELHLVANTIENPLAEKLFTSTCAIADSASPPGSSGENYRRGLQKGYEYTRQVKPDLIWVQHYSIMSGLIWASLCRIPLLLAVHGPVRGVGRIGDRADALALTRLVMNGAPLSTVSREITEQLHDLGLPPVQITSAPNGMERSRFTAASHPPGNRIDCVMLARQQKLDHIRAGLTVFSALRRRAPGTRLRLFTGMRYESTGNYGGGGGLPALVRLLGRKWLLRNPGVGMALWAVEISTLSDNPEGEIARADVVLGMGRVLLEAISAGKVPVLIGYHNPVAVVTGANVSGLAYSNYSGRGQPAVKPATLADSIVDTMTRDRGEDISDLQQVIALESQGADLLELVRQLSGAEAPMVQQGFGEDTDSGQLREQALRVIRGELTMSEFLEVLEAGLDRTGQRMLAGLLE